jgi:hypothetical protein
MAFNKICPPRIPGVNFHIIGFKNSDNVGVEELETRQKKDYTYG